MSLVVYVKGSNFPNVAKKKLGSCIESHRVLMVLHLEGYLPGAVNVVYIDERLKQRDTDFAKVYTTMIPVMVNNALAGDNEFDSADEIADHLKLKSPGDPEVRKWLTKEPMIPSLFTWLKNKDALKEPVLLQKLVNSLKKLENFILSKRRDGKLDLDGKTLTFSDCSLLPILYHADIAAKFVKEYDLFSKFPNITEYMKNGMSNDTFVQTCPSEDEITEQWRLHHERIRV